MDFDEADRKISLSDLCLLRAIERVLVNSNWYVICRDQ